MPKRILILDDDTDFAGLLNDIYKQSDYQTTAVHDPIKALELLRTEPFDLLVTDHRMPGMTGELLIRELRTSHPILPVIVISGFLDNDTIRSLIRDGVGGIFMKPLNVMSLLRRTGMLLEEADLRAGRATNHDESDFQSPLPFDFKTFPCQSLKTQEFAHALKSKSAFKGTLTLTCPPGIPIRSLIADIETLSEGVHPDIRLISNRNISEDLIRHHLDEYIATGTPPTLAFQNLDFANDEAKTLVIALGTRRPPFNDLPAPPSLIFTFTHPVDELYERGKLQESLYVLTSITELRVPRLAEATEDIPIMAARILKEYCQNNGITPALRINNIAQIWLRDQPWPGNLEELYTQVINAAHMPHSGALTRESFDVSQSEQHWADGTNAVHSLHDYLKRLRDDYILAVLMLCDFDTALAAQVLGTAKGMLDMHHHVKSRT